MNYEAEEDYQFAVGFAMPHDSADYFYDEYLESSITYRQRHRDLHRMHEERPVHLSFPQKINHVIKSTETNNQ